MSRWGAMFRDDGDIPRAGENLYMAGEEEDEGSITNFTINPTDDKGRLILNGVMVEIECEYCNQSRRVPLPTQTIRALQQRKNVPGWKYGKASVVGAVRCHECWGNAGDISPKNRVARSTLIIQIPYAHLNSW